MDKYVVARDQHETAMEQAIEKKVEDRYETRLKTLSDQIETLKQAQKATSGGKP